ncbi:hypothetical protein V6N13_021964 [Hibiscus sabdariffa]|uniref:Uncharacterized protein n=1 Tax=Hibiscus sabdariffa TaxID=183260 RepID=A0ABR2CQ73_9ROSI
MEKFYALINSIREARDRFIINNKKKKRKLEEGNGGVAAWKPSFQREDFMEEADQLKKPSMRLATPCQSQAKEEESGKVLKEEVKECLDLTLSLFNQKFSECRG